MQKKQAGETPELFHKGKVNQADRIIVLEQITN
jgi:hypothetical protein